MTFRSMAVALTAVALACATSAPAAAKTKPGASFEMTYKTTGGYTYSVDVTCKPAGGTHSDPAGVCKALDQAGGDFDMVTPWPDRVCTAEYAPVTLGAKGHWLGEKFSWSKTFGNKCEAQVATAGIFDF
jgi:hypothetical protein